MKIKKFAIYLPVLALLVACASMGTPDGGPYDEDPPVLVKAVPALYATNIKEGKVELLFDENIKLVNAFDKVVVSPPQRELPEIKSVGKRVSVELFDTLIPNTTYSVDFGDAIVDNNEGNPYENFAYVFSTGDVVDTLAVSGTVLNAEDLEPIKGMMVGLHSCLDDSAFTTKAFERVSRTDSRGRFTIKGIAPGKYRVYALSDVNQNYLFDQKSEKLAFMDTSVSPFASVAYRSDTIWRDTLTVDTVMSVRYTRFQPDDIVLRAFLEKMNMQYLIKSLRQEHNIVRLFFAAPNEQLPKIEGIGFDFNDAYVLEASEKNDTLTYWLKDSVFYRNDTLAFAVTYKAPDSLGLYIDKSDTLRLVPKRKWERIVKERAELFEEEKKHFLRRESRKDGYDKENPPLYVPPTKALPLRFSGTGTMDVNKVPRFAFEEPLLSLDTSALHLFTMVDTTWVPTEFVLQQSERSIREYELFAEWRPECKYRLEVDSAAFKGLYGGVSEKFEREMVFRSLDEYAVLFLNIKGAGSNSIVQLLNTSQKVVAQERTRNGECSFYFIKPGKYFLRLIVDENNNGVWDTGSFADGLQPEKVYYYHHRLDLMALFEYTQDDWDITMPLEKQKPIEITKQKPEKERKKQNRNATRKFKSKKK